MHPEEWAQYRDRKSRKFFHERKPRAGKHIDSAMRTIASPSPFTPSPIHPPVEAIRDESPASMGAMEVAWCGARIPAEINSERRGIQRLSRRSRNRFQAIISATLQNDRSIFQSVP